MPAALGAPVNKLSSVLGAAAVIAIAVVFILQFRPATGQTKGDTGPVCVAEVHGSCLSTGSFWAAYRLIAGSADPNRMKGVGLRRKVAEGLVEQWALNQDAKRLGITASDDDVRSELAAGRAHVSLPAAEIQRLGYQLRLGEDLVRPIQVKGAKTVDGKKVRVFERKTYEKEVRRLTRMSPEDFLEYQKAEVVAARMRDIIRSRVHVGDNEVYDQFARDKSTASVDYIRFDRRFFADLVVDMSPGAMGPWLVAHKDEIDRTWDSRKAQVLPECRAVREVFVKMEEGATDEDKAAAGKKMERARERISAGEDFAAVAKALSDDPSASNGGELGCLLKGKAPKVVEDAVLALAAGKVSDVIATDGGLFLVKVDQIEKDDAAVKLGRDFVGRELYVTQESERLAVEAAKNVLAATKGGKPLKDALALYLQELARSRPAPANATTTKATKNPKAKAKKAGAADKDEPKADEGRPTLTLENHPNRPTVETTLPFSAGGDPITGARQASEITRAAFSLDKPGDTAGDLVALENGYAVIQLKEKTAPTKEQWDKDRELYMASMRAYKADDALATYMKRLTDQVAKDVKFTTALVTEPKASEQGPMGPSDDDSGE